MSARPRARRGRRRSARPWTGPAGVDPAVHLGRGGRRRSLSPAMPTRFAPPGGAEGHHRPDAPEAVGGPMVVTSMAKQSAKATASRRRRSGAVRAGRRRARPRPGAQPLHDLPRPVRSAERAGDRIDVVLLVPPDQAMFEPHVIAAMTRRRPRRGTSETARSRNRAPRRAG